MRKTCSRYEGINSRNVLSRRLYVKKPYVARTHPLEINRATYTFSLYDEVALRDPIAVKYKQKTNKTIFRESSLKIVVATGKRSRSRP